MRKALAIDIGGTKIYNCIVNEKGEIVSDINKHSTPKDLCEIQNLIKDIIKTNEDNVDTIAIATCGAVNNDNTKIIGSTGNIAEGYSSTDFQSMSKKNVFVENDANAAAWAEHIIGASKGAANSVMLTLGTGVGGGIIIDNKLLKGKSGAAGEMHFKLSRDKKRKCTCGSYDCFEIYASGNGLRLTAVEITGNPDITTYDVIEGVNNNNKACKAALRRWMDDIVDGIIGLANIFDPDCVVLSGSMAQFTDTDYITSEVNKYLVTPNTKVVKGSAGNYSGMIGAALLALRVN